MSLCLPTSPRTVLFGYSNDLSSSTVLSLWTFIGEPDIFPNFAKFANVRFDTVDAGVIYYHDSFADANPSVLSHLPDPTLSFPDNETGSDVLKFIEQFMDNPSVSVCGAKIFILMKRMPEITDISRLVVKLRQHHAFLSVISSATVSGSYYNDNLMYSLTTQTLGFRSFERDDNFIQAQGYFGALLNPYLIYAVNPIVQDSGTLELPVLSVPKSDYYNFMISIRDHDRWGISSNGVLKWYNFQLPDSGNFSYRSDHQIQNDVGTQSPLKMVPYRMTMDYNYTDMYPETLQIRIMGQVPIDYWMPFD